MKLGITVLIILLAMLIFNSAILYVNLQLKEMKEDLDRCKALGYDGVKFVTKFSKKVECSNFTELEKAKREENSEVAK